MESLCISDNCKLIYDFLKIEIKKQNKTQEVIIIVIEM